MRYATTVTGSVYDAEEVLQEALLKLWKHAKDLDTETNPELSERWLIKVTKNLAIDSNRRNARATPVSFLEPSNDGLGEGGTQAIIFNHPRQLDDPVKRLELRENLDQFHKLPPLNRRALFLRAFGYSRPEIADKMGIRSTSVESRVHVGRKIIRERLAFASLREEYQIHVGDQELEN